MSVLGGVGGVLNTKYLTYSSCPLAEWPDRGDTTLEGHL